MRTDIHFKLICAECGNELEADSKKSKFEFHSAYNAEAKMSIKHCRECYRKAIDPALKMKEALEALNNKIDYE